MVESARRKGEIAIRFFTHAIDLVNVIEGQRVVAVAEPRTASFALPG